MATVSELLVLVTANTSGFQKGMASAEKTTTGFSTIAKVGFGIAAVAAVKFAADAIESYNDHQDALLRLQNTIKNSPQLVGASVKAFEDQATTLQHLTGVQDEEILRADALLGRFQLTAQQIQELNPLILDYAKATGLDAAGAADKLGKAVLGNAKALKTLGINFKATGNTTKDFNDITDLLQSKVGGLAEAYGKTLPGQLDIAAASFDDIKEVVGGALVPILSKLLDLVKPLIGVLKLAADNLDIVVVAGLAFAGWKFIPPLLGAVAEGLGVLGFTGLGVAALDAAAAIGSVGTAAITAVPAIGFVGAQALASAAGTQTAAERTAELKKQLDAGAISAGEAAAQMRGIVPPAKAVADHLGDVADNSHKTAAEQEDLAGKIEKVTFDMKAQKEAAQQLAGGILGLTADALDLADKQKIVNQMQEAGHDSGAKYNQAILDLLNSQVQFKADAADFVDQLQESGLSLDDAKDKVINLGRSVGLTRQDVLDAIGSLDKYKSALDGLPSKVTTDVITNFIQVGNINPGGPHPRLQHGGIVTRPTVGLIGEAGPEAVIPLDKANALGGIKGDIVLQIDGQTYARITRDQLLKLKASRGGHLDLA